MMTYKNYSAEITYSAEDDLLVGRIVGIRDIVAFHGTSLPEMHRKMEEIIEEYLAACEAEGKVPDPGCNG